MLTPFFLSLSSHSPLGLSLSPAEFAIVKSTFSNTAKREYYGRVIFVLPPPRTSLVVSVLFYISIHDTRTHHYTLLNLACLENTWKMSLLEGGCPMSITIHTSPNWINRSIVVQSRSHLWVSVPRRRKLPRIFFYFLRPLFLPFAAPPCICCGRTISQQRYPLSINRCKRAATRPYQPPGLIKSNFFFYWPTAKRCCFSVFSHNNLLPSVFDHASPKSRKLSYRIAIVRHNSIHHIHASSVRQIFFF